MSQLQAQNPPPLQPAPVNFLDVPTLLETSRPRARNAWVVPAVSALVVLVLVSAYLSTRSSAMKALVDAASGLLMIVIAGSMAALMWNMVRRQREERSLLEAIEEMVQLRRWAQAAGMLQLSLSRPALTQGGRVQLLIFLATVLARYGRFDDAIEVQNSLLDEVDLDPSTQHALQLGRVMAMLRQDHLVDADRAINELRRNVSRVASIVEEARQAQTLDDFTDTEATEKPPADLMVSGGLALIEIYRDVKTGHAAEAIENFNRALPTMRKQLGHRVGDAYGLAAKAYDFLNDAGNAQSNWEKATLLSATVELVRRYPELASMVEKYPAASAPAEIRAEAA